MTGSAGLLGRDPMGLRRIALVMLLGTLASCGSGRRPEEAGATPPGNPPPSVSLSASASSVSTGSSVGLSWTSQNATTCTAGGGWSGTKATAGSETVGPLTTATTFSLNCSGPGGSDSKSVNVAVSGTSAPTLTFAANPTSVAAGGSSALTWNAVGATGCTASGGWSGAKAASGTETRGPLNANTTFNLMCTGAGGSVNGAVTVQVTASPPAAPTVTLSVNPTSVVSGGSTTLSWSSTNATTCTASGGWTGTRATTGTETSGPLTATQTFTLACNGSGGSASKSVVVTVNPGGPGTISGSVDSSLIDAAGDNRIYVWSGDVTPDDFDGDSGDPIASVQVLQDANACTFSYLKNSLAAGTYTIAFTAQAAQDVPGQNNTLTFSGRKVITVGSTAVQQDFAAANVLRVGPSRTFTTLRAANAAAHDGDTIEIDAGTYTDDVTVWRQNDVVLRGRGGRAHLHGTKVIPFVSGDDQQNGKGLLVVSGSNIRLENMEFSGSQVTDQNGAGVRNEGRNLTICNGYFHDNENGFLGGAYGTLTVEYSELAHNGFGDIGHTHNIYVDDGGSAGDQLVFRYNYSHHANIGHLLKTRAAVNYVLYNRLTDEADGTASYELDVPNGGRTFVIGNLIEQGPATDNAIIIAYGAEGLSGGRTHELYLVNNTIVNDRGSGTFMDVASGTAVFRTINNLFVGSGTLASGKTAQATTNLQTAAPQLVNLDGFDYHLTAASPARDAGSAPGTASGVDLTPVFQYQHPAQRQARPVSGTMDVGAYEFTP